MTKIVNSWNEWDPLKFVLLGRVEGSNIPAPEPAGYYDIPQGGYPLPNYGPYPEEMVVKAAEQMDGFQKILEKRGVKVERIKIEPFMSNENMPVSTPDWTHPNNHGASNVRDLTLVHGNMIIESTGIRRSRWYEYLNVRRNFQGWFDQDPEVLWISAPKPRLTNKSYVKNYFYDFKHVWSADEKRERALRGEFQLTEEEPLWDAADVFRFGKDIFHQVSSTSNRGGVKWLKRLYDSLGLRLHELISGGNLFPWHIDASFVLIEPGKMLYNPEWPIATPQFWELFKQNDWELIPCPASSIIDDALCGVYATTGTPTWISMNTLNLGPKTQFIEAREKNLADKLDSYGVEVIPVPYDGVIPFGGSLHCTTLDIYREGGCEDYFPRQIPGY